VNERGWQPEQLISRIVELSAAFLVTPPPAKVARKKAVQ